LAVSVILLERDIRLETGETRPYDPKFFRLLVETRVGEGGDYRGTEITLKPVKKFILVDGK